jgi:uncharacterized protein (DUF1684 family)
MKLNFALLGFLLIISSCVSVAKEIMTHRESYKQGFLMDPRSPLQAEDLVHLDFFPADAKGKIEATFILTPDAETFEMPTYSGITRTYRKWGYALFQYDRNQDTLSIYENMTLRSNPVYKDYLFLPFKDETNGVSTYGGGRYMNMSKADTEDGKIIIDFNKCYNPWCAYSEGYNCPIPPSENHLTFAVEAGERKFLGDVKR